MTQPPEDFASGLSSQTSAALMAMVMAAGQIAEIIVSARAEKARREAEQHRETARVFRAQLAQDRGAAAELWRRAERDDWWRRATPNDISALWTSAASWQHIDPRAADTLSMVRDRLNRRGVRVEQPAGAQPGDTSWIREAVNLADEERRASGPTTPGADSDGQQPGRSVARSPEERNLHATAVYERLPDDDRQRIADAVRTGWSEKADDLIGCRAWPALAGRIWERGQAGHDMTETARRLATNDISDAHTPAALTCWIFDRMELRAFNDRAEVVAGEVVEAPAQPTAGRGTGAEAAPAAQGGSVEGSRAREVNVKPEQLPKLLASMGDPGQPRTIDGAATATPATAVTPDRSVATPTEPAASSTAPSTPAASPAASSPVVNPTAAEVANAQRIAQGYPTPAEVTAAAAAGQGGAPAAAQRQAQRSEAAPAVSR